MVIVGAGKVSVWRSGQLLDSDGRGCDAAARAAAEDAAAAETNLVDLALALALGFVVGLAADLAADLLTSLRGAFGMVGPLEEEAVVVVLMVVGDLDLVSSTGCCLFADASASWDDAPSGKGEIVWRWSCDKLCCEGKDESPLLLSAPEDEALKVFLPSVADGGAPPGSRRRWKQARNN